MSNLIEVVSKLKGLGTKADIGRPCIAIEDRSNSFIMISNPDYWARIAYIDGSNSHNAKWLAGINNATPKLLDILGEIQPGDATMLKFIMEDIEKRNYDVDRIEVLRRYLRMAAKMEVEMK
jgi:hypothetical protein